MGKPVMNIKVLKIEDDLLFGTDQNSVMTSFVLQLEKGYNVTTKGYWLLYQYAIFNSLTLQEEVF